ncbi:MAG: hypothetical protein JW776_03085 [Candidatus Lokiarchaeota archaeon]|nr:hypothetical protein [Candidatus Lokiarchaeota archaeon]
MGKKTTTSSNSKNSADSNQSGTSNDADSKNKENPTGKTKSSKKNVKKHSENNSVEMNEKSDKIVKEVIEATNDIIEKKQKEAEAEGKTELPEKFWQQDEWRVLLDPNLVKSDQITQYDLSALITEFTNKMLTQDLVDFRISGMAIYSTAKLHHRKIRDVIDEEEQIQIRELRDKARREIPKAMPQPIREPLKIATRDELFDAMRAAIIETMQKRELLRRKRIARESKKAELKIVKSTNKLPLEILKHIMGKERTVEQTLDYWFDKIRSQIKNNGGKQTTYDEMCEKVIAAEIIDSYGQRLKNIELFLSLLFLSTAGRIMIDQETDFDVITITIPRHIL